MNKYVLYENSYADLNNIDQDIFKDFVDIGAQIKNELGLASSPIEFVSSNCVYIGNIVGNVALNDTVLHIFPKFTSYPLETVASTEELSRRLFMKTIKCAIGSLNSTVYFIRNATIDNQSLFFDVLANYYLDSIIKALKKSKIYLYEDVVEKSSTIKGRILVQKQLSQPVSDEKTWCKFKRMTNNNVYNQLLFWGCKYLCELTGNLNLKRKLLNISREFPQSINMLSTAVVERIRVPRQFSEFAESIDLAKNMYLKDSGKKEKLGEGKRISGYVINMERSFENIVCYYSRIAASALGYAHKSQAIMHFATSSYANDFDYYVKPDGLISKKQRHLVIDAKYKVITMRQGSKKKKPSRDDFYQMVSSCVAYNCPEAVLIYPATAAFPDMSWNTINSINGTKITVRATSVDLMLNEDAMVNVFTDIIRNTNFYREKTK